MNWLIQFFQLLTAWIPRLQYLQPNEAGIRLTLGSRIKSVGPGWWFYWPLVHRILSCFNTPQVLDLPPQTVWTKNRKRLTISLTMRFSVTDARMALLNVYDYDQALQNLARGVVAEYISQHTLEECSNVSALLDKCKGLVQKEARGWGINLQRLYVDQITDAQVIRLLMNIPALQAGEIG